MRSGEICRKAVFLDRDGTINVEKQYLINPEEMELIAGSAEAIRGFNEQGFFVIVITNQAGVARGYFSEGDIIELHKHFDKELEKLNAKVDAYYFCPHHPNYGDKLNCECRKPEPGLILRAAEDFNVDLSNSYLVGDKAIDVNAALAAGVTPVMVATGYGMDDHNKVNPKIAFVDDLLAAYKAISGKVSGK